MKCFHDKFLLRACIPNFKPNIRVGFWVGTSFLQFPTFVNSECSETPFLTLKPSKIGFFDPKTGKYFRNLFTNYFRKIFASSKRPDISKKFPNFRKQNYSETRENKKFGKFHLSQGLSFFLVDLTSKHQGLTKFWNQSENYVKHNLRFELFSHVSFHLKRNVATSHLLMSFCCELRFLTSYLGWLKPTWVLGKQTAIW